MLHCIVTRFFYSSGLKDSLIIFMVCCWKVMSTSIWLFMREVFWSYVLWVLSGCLKSQQWSLATVAILLNDSDPPAPVSCNHSIQPSIGSVCGAHRFIVLLQSLNLVSPSWPNITLAWLPELSFATLTACSLAYRSTSTNLHTGFFCLVPSALMSPLPPSSCSWPVFVCLTFFFSSEWHSGEQEQLACDPDLYLYRLVQRQWSTSNYLNQRQTQRF